MAQFPIQYSERVPSGRAPAVKADIPQIDVRTGAPQLQEEYARRGAGIAGLGKDIFELAMTIRKQEDVAEFSELKRKFDEAGWATYNAVTGNEEADVKLLSKFEQDFSGDQSKRGNVNNMLRQHINKVMPDWHENIFKKQLGIKRQNVKDKFNLEAENLLGQGNLPEYYKQLHTRLALQDISQAEFDFKVANAPNDSVLQQMRLSIGNNNPQGAIELATQIKDASADQMDYRDNLIRMAEQNLKQNSDAAEIEVISNLHTNKDKSLVERATLGNQYITQLTIKGLTGARYGVLVDRIEKWMAGEDVKTDLRSYTKMKEALQDLSLGTKTKSEVQDLILSTTSNLSDTDAKSFIDETYTEPDKEDKFWEKEAYQTIEKRLLTTDPISGRLFGSTEQYDNCDRAKIRFDDAIKSAAKAGKPLRGNDYLKKAVDVANQLAPKAGKITFGGQTKLPPTEYEEFVIKPEAILTSPVRYEVGQIVYQAGKQWRIAGFDKDGEPLVDEVK